MVASLQGALKVDSESGEKVPPATARNDASEWDVDDTESEGSDSDLGIQGRFLGDEVSTTRHPRAFSRIVCEHPPPTFSYVNPKP